MQDGKPRILKRVFTPEEDMALKDFVSQYGCDWKLIASRLPSRTPRSCKERYYNYIAPGPQQEWTKKEDEILMAIHHEPSTSWKPITSKFRHRSAQSVKNRYNLLHPETRKKGAETPPKGLPSASTTETLPKEPPTGSPRTNDKATSGSTSGTTKDSTDNIVTDFVKVNDTAIVSDNVTEQESLKSRLDWLDSPTTSLWSSGEELSTSYW